MSRHSHCNPFKFLDSYTLEDRDLFFGRDYEISELYSTFYTRRLTVVFGESGTGKTSLIQCGLQAEIPVEDVLFIFVRTANDPLESLKKELLDKFETFPEETGLDYLLEELWYQESRTLVLILDQFEELFLLCSAGKRKNFIEQLSHWSKLPYIRLIISLREDYYAYLTELESDLPEIYDNRLRLLPMSKLQARDAIVKPCQHNGIEIEEALVESLLDDLLAENKEIDLPILQVSLDALYQESVKNNSNKLTQKNYLNKGGVSNILVDFIGSTLGTYNNAKIAQKILITLVTKQGTRKVRKLEQIKEDILDDSTISESLVESLLIQLSEDRLIRENTREDIYELRHDSLAKALLAWTKKTELKSAFYQEQKENRYRILLNKNLIPEIFVRQALSLLEADLREMALLCFQEWSVLGIVSPDLFNTVASLRFPSWGSWNGLIISIRKIYNHMLQTADKNICEKIELSPLSDLFAHLAQDINKRENEYWLKPFYTQSQQPLPKKITLQYIFSVPISIRNRIAHGNPGNKQYWDGLANAFSLTIEWLAEQDFINYQYKIKHSSPWFITKNNEHFTYRGLSSKGDVIHYVNSDGIIIESKQYTHEVLLAIKTMMGKADIQEIGFRKLLGKLAPEESKGILMGDYLVGKLVTEATHSSIHKGWQLSTGRQVAIKFLKDGLSDEIALRFKQEAEFLSRLSHPNIINVFSYSENQAWEAPKLYDLTSEPWYKKFRNGTRIKTFTAMEWIEGKTLDDYYEKQKIANALPDYPKITQWFIDATKALELIHQSNIIHLGIKPRNLMIDDQGNIKLIGLGVARSSYNNIESGLTINLNSRLGSPVYMSPEQILAINNDSEDCIEYRTDIYSLTAVFYELYTQQRLYNHDDKNITIETIIQLKIHKQERPTLARAVQ